MLTLPQGNLPTFIFPCFGLGYLILLMIQCARYASYYQHALYRKKAGIQKMPASLRLFVEEIAKQLGIAQRVYIWLTPWVESPLTMGFLKSIILFPLAMISHLSTKQVEALLLHELAHIKRNDYLLNMFVTIANIAFFFNPFSRALIRHIRKEMENSCDDLVIQFGYEPGEYCSALLSLEKNRSPFSFALAASGRADYLLLDRVKRITGLQSKLSPNRSNNSLVLLGLACGLMLFILPLPKAKQVSHPQIVISDLAHTHSLPSLITPIRINEAQFLEIGSFKGYKSHETVGKRKVSEPINYLDDYSSQVRENQSELSSYPSIMEATQPIPLPDYSMDPAPFSSRIAVPGESSAKEFPFVANSSFSFHIVEDSLISTKEQINDGDDAADELIRKAIITLDQLSRKQKNQVIKSEKKIDQLRSLIQATLDARDVESLMEEKKTGLTNAEIERIKNNLDLHRKILQNINLSKNAAEANKLKESIINGQLKLHRDALLKQLSELKKIQEFLKINKIVYI